MKRITLFAAVAGMFAMTGCSSVQCWNCSCDTTQTTVSTASSVENVGGATTTVITENDATATSTFNPTCAGDMISIGSSGSHAIESENMDGTHTYVDTSTDEFDNGFSTVTTTNVTTTTFVCACTEVD
ncbi:MAG: hypothetical protein ACI9FU_001865 [Granulosicoccus sp.]|jgi:hypothetical protein